LKAGKVKALADIKHAFRYCRCGLVDIIRFLYRMLLDLRARRLKSNHSW